MQFRYYPAERLRIESIASRLQQSEARLRNEILSGLIRQQAPLSPDLLTAAAAEATALDELLQALSAKRAIVRNDSGAITFAYPVSALPTPHRVTLADGRSFHAMCAVDAMGSAFTFHQDISITSCCSECHHPVSVHIRNRRLASFSPAGLHVLHVDLNRSDNWSGSC